jgi:hypothetical protein
MPRVFVVNEPLRRDRDTGLETKAINLAPARQFGELVFLLPAGQIPFDPAPTIRQLTEGLQDMTSDDYLLPVGDMRAIAWACAIASVRCGGSLRILHWSSRAYTPITARLWTAHPMVAA